MEGNHHRPLIKTIFLFLSFPCFILQSSFELSIIWTKALVFTMNQTLSRRLLSFCAIYALSSTVNLVKDIHVVEAFSHSTMSSQNISVPSLRGSRILTGSTITTPKCENIRTEEYPAELQLFYTYSVEISDDLLLYDMERAIDNAVIIELDMCDVKGRPVYKVRTSTSHSFSTSRK